MRYRQPLWKASFTTSPNYADALSSAVEEAQAVSLYAPPRTGKAQIEAIYSSPPDLQALTARLTILAALQGIKTPQISLTEVPNLDWLQKVSEDFPPLPLSRWTIYGASHRQAITKPRYALQIDATSAFGTGEHPTTQGCLLLLHQLLKRRNVQRILDMGCGSGILAMAGLKARAATAVGVDMDKESVSIARHNARANGLQKRLRIDWSHGYRARSVKHGAPYDLIMSNIFAVPLSHMAKDLRLHLQPGGDIILAGLLHVQANRVLSAHRRQKIYLKKRVRLGEWSILALKRPLRAK